MSKETRGLVVVVALWQVYAAIVGAVAGWFGVGMALAIFLWSVWWYRRV